MRIFNTIFLVFLTSLSVIAATIQPNTPAGKSPGGAPSGFVTPQAYGAKGDGTTDDSAALQAWLFYGCSSNWICFLPPAPGGSYACSTTLLITNGMNYINLQGAGGAAFNSDGPNQNFCLIKFTTANDGIRITNVQSNVQFEGIRLTNSAAYSFATHGIWFDGNSGDSDCSSIRHCSAQGFGRGLLLSSVADTTVENCSFGVDGVGIEIAGGTYANPPVVNQVRIIGCQLSYNYTNQLHITNAGQYVFVQSCDMAPQVGATDAALKIERNAYVTLSDMHIEPYNSKPCIIVTDNGVGAGGTFLNLYNVVCSLDGTAANATTYSIVATNANVTLMNVGLSDVADGSFSMFWNGDVNVLTSDKSILSRIVVAANIGTNYLGGNFIRGKNSGVVGTYIREGEFLREFTDYNNAPGGGIGGGYILSHLYYGLRQFDNDGSLGTVAVNLGQYYEDRTANGPGISSTNGFLTGTGTSRTPILTNFTAYSSGTIYTMTASFATVAFGTTSPSVTFNNGGTYLLFAGANFTARGATYAATNTISIKLRKTSGTPADLANSTISETIPIITTTSEALGKLTIPVVFTAASADVVVIQATVSATPSAGNVICDSAEIVAVKLY